MYQPLGMLLVGLLGTVAFLVGFYGYKRNAHISNEKASLGQLYTRTKDIYLMGFGAMFMLVGYMSLFDWLGLF